MNIKYLLSLTISLFILVVSGQQCFDQSSVTYTTSGTQLQMNGQTIRVQGIAWFGLETLTFSPGGLQTKSVEQLLDVLVAQKFNVLRLPFSVDMILKPRMPNQINYGLNPNLAGLNAFQVFEYITKACATRGILVVAEMHRFDPNDYIPGLWYSTQCIYNIDGQCINYTTDVVTNAWITVVNTLQKYWNFWAVDVKNEPHGTATWGTGNTATDWDAAFKNIANTIQSKTGFKGVYFIEGIENNAGSICSPATGNWWGGNLSPQQCFPVFLATPNKLVFTPHTYCSSVSDQPYFNDPSYPSNMPSVWDASFGFLKSSQPVVIGEWGCKNNNTKNSKWISSFVSYLKSTGMTNHIYFSLNPDSADTDSILNPDWTTINQNVAGYLNDIGTNPSIFSLSGNKVCLGPISTTSTVSSTTIGGSTTTTTGSGTTTTSTTSKPTTTTSQSTTTTGGGSTTTTSTSTTSKPTTTTTTTSQSTTTGGSSTTTTTTSTTGGGSSTTTTAGATTTGGSTTGHTSTITIQQILSSSWTDSNNKPWSVYNCFITNTGSSAIQNVKFSSVPNVAPDQSWGAYTPANVNGNWIWSAQSWALTLQPNQPTNFGYQVQSATPFTFTIVQ
ncbi:putative cellulase [Heterostelium album PN500]|uniref:Putative cellulase n=1 Tax=Heterostelium pallidum (strain ATCC 26659 / Pp 5 / PN500) TaxID=670386 RepID=D3BL49_HETP5|nr:putative cellulase [Heterostelium album PN500]EFA77783.1 putative cellulase [Heterostelium album PN500]|eukprot:XP_020429911.1 putative cellulase [Heterostelium album PN500]